MLVVYYTCRGDEFRVAFALLGELRSIIPTGINVLALTATATMSTLAAVKRRLSMVDPVIIGIPPNRDNIKFIVRPLSNARSFCASLSEEMKSKGIEYPKTVIFCNYKSCAELYHRLRHNLGPHFTIPPFYHKDLVEYRILEMYT